MWLLVVAIAGLLLVAILLSAAYGPEKVSVKATAEALDTNTSKNETSTLSGYSDADLLNAALKLLWPLPDASALFPKSDAQLDQIDQWVATKQEWVDTIADKRTRRAFQRWIDHVTRGLQENREENRTHRRQKEHEAWLKRSNEESSRAHEAAKHLPRPN